MGIIFLFIGTSVIPGISRNIEREKIDDVNIPPFIKTTLNGNDDLLDQHQDIHEANTHVYHEYYIAQSFTPSFSKLTRVKLYMHQLRNPEGSIGGAGCLDHRHLVASAFDLEELRHLGGEGTEVRCSHRRLAGDDVIIHVAPDADHRDAFGDHHARVRRAGDRQLADGR